MPKQRASHSEGRLISRQEAIGVVAATVAAVVSGNYIFRALTGSSTEQDAAAADERRHAALEQTATAAAGRPEAGDLAQWPAEAARAAKDNTFRIAFTFVDNTGKVTYHHDTAWVVAPIQGIDYPQGHTCLVTAAHGLSDLGRQGLTLQQVQLYRAQAGQPWVHDVPLDGFAYARGTDTEYDYPHDIGLIAVDNAKLQLPQRANDGLQVRLDSALAAGHLAGFPDEMGVHHPGLYGNTCHTVQNNGDHTWRISGGLGGPGMSGAPYMDERGAVYAIETAHYLNPAADSLVTQLTSDVVAGLFQRVNVQIQA